MSAHIATLPAGAEFFDWIRAGGSPERVGRRWLWLYRWRAFWFEQNIALQKMQTQLNTKNAMEAANCLLVMGFWRSGTTLVHDHLSALSGVATPTTRQCMDPSTAFLLPLSPNRLDGAPRPMDSALIHADSPQEDEFALMALGVKSVYRCFVDPRRWSSTLPALDPAFWQEARSGGWLQRWQAFLAECKGGSATLVVKSPNHSFRWPALATTWPGARYVLLTRPAEELWQSNRKMWNAMSQQYALWTGPEGWIDEFLSAAFSAYVGVLKWAIENISPTDCIAVDFNGLMSDAAAERQRIARHFSLPQSTSRQVTEATRPDQYAADFNLNARFGPLLRSLDELHQLALRRFCG